jgi:hypothetical protein
MDLFRLAITVTVTVALLWVESRIWMKLRPPWEWSWYRVLRSHFRAHKLIPDSYSFSYNKSISRFHATDNTVNPLDMLLAALLLFHTMLLIGKHSIDHHLIRNPPSNQSFHSGSPLELQAFLDFVSAPNHKMSLSVLPDLCCRQSLMTLEGLEICTPFNLK